jgi:hypothetical protein
VLPAIRCPGGSPPAFGRGAACKKAVGHMLGRVLAALLPRAHLASGY